MYKCISGSVSGSQGNVVNSNTSHPPQAILFKAVSDIALLCARAISGPYESPFSIGIQHKLLFVVSSFCATFFLLSPSTLVHHFLSPFLHFLSVNLLCFLHPLFICMVTVLLIVTSAAPCQQSWLLCWYWQWRVEIFKFGKACSNMTFVPVLNLQSLKLIQIIFRSSVSTSPTEKK